MQNGRGARAPRLWLPSDWRRRSLKTLKVVKCLRFHFVLRYTLCGTAGSPLKQNVAYVILKDHMSSCDTATVLRLRELFVCFVKLLLFLGQHS